MIILPVDRPWLTTSPLLEEELVLAVDPGHPLAGRRSIRVAELERVPLVMFKDGYDLREATIEACRRAGFAPLLAMSGLEMDGALALARGRCGRGRRARVGGAARWAAAGRALSGRHAPAHDWAGVAPGPPSFTGCPGLRDGPGRHWLARVED